MTYESIRSAEMAGFRLLEETIDAHRGFSLYWEKAHAIGVLPSGSGYLRCPNFKVALRKRHLSIKGSSLPGWRKWQGEFCTCAFLSESDSAALKKAFREWAESVAANLGRYKLDTELWHADEAVRTAEADLERRPYDAEIEDALAQAIADRQVAQEALNALL